MKSKLAFWATLFFSCIGMMVISNYVHEMIHYNDFKPFVVDNYVCLLTLNPDLGSPGAFNYIKYDQNNITQARGIEQVRTYTELDAYAASILILLLWLGLSTKFIWDYLMDDFNVRYVYKKEGIK